MSSNIFQNVTRTSLAQGTAMLIVLAAGVMLELSQRGTFGFMLTGVPLWLFGIIASAGGILFFLGPMLFGTDPPPRSRLSAEKIERGLFIYLRPFELDTRTILQLLVGASTGIFVYVGILKTAFLWYPIIFLPFIININKEQNFQEVFKTFGDFIAFGQSGEWLRPIGASRVYALDDWKLKVRHYMSVARLVIIRPGESPSIQWEIEQLHELVPPDRIVFYLKFRGWKKRKERAYQSFRNHLQSCVPTKLPPQLGTARFLVFDESWHPRFVEEANQPSQLLSQIFSRSGDVTRDNMRPVLKALNLELPSRPNNLLNNVATVGVWLAAIFAVALTFIALSIATIRVSTAFFLFLLRRALG